MSASTENVAEQLENIALWINQNRSVDEKEEEMPTTNNVNNFNKYLSPSTTTYPKMRPSNKVVHNNNNNSNAFYEICKKVQSGHKLMIFMRGAPGSGKTTLAKSLLLQTRLLDQSTVQDFVFSSDDYFHTQRGYQFNPNMLPEAHEWNRRRVCSKAAEGWGPIIVDNTNMMLWEMQPYVVIAVQHGYMLEILEPQTTWAKSASKLAQKNVHQVPRDSIQRMLDRYEPATVPDLLKLLKELKYSVSLPQLRLKPPLCEVPEQGAQQVQHVVGNSQKFESTNTPSKLNINAPNWIPYEQNAPQYWLRHGNQEGFGVPTANPAPSGDGSLLDLLRDDQTSSAELSSSADAAVNTSLQRHSIDCPNEPSGFAQLRQMYTNKQVSSLWDLYVKCNADLDWVVEILLKENELNQDAEDEYLEDQNDQFQCACNKATVPMSTPAIAPPLSSSAKYTAKPQRQPRTRRNAGGNSSNSGSNRELQLHVQNCFVLGDDQYSEHTRKIRDIRNGTLDPSVEATVQQINNIANGGADEDDEFSEATEFLEMELGVELIDQLRSNFQSECEMLTVETEIRKTKVFLPRPLAQQLYMVYMESVHNEVEEQRHKTLHDDEQFARLLKNPNYADCIESPRNVNELLDMELALSIYNSENQAATQAKSQKPNDIATHLTKLKLFEKFPEIPQDTILDIFESTDNNYTKTLEVLDCNVKSDLTSDELYRQALSEKEKLNVQEQLEARGPQSKVSNTRYLPRNIKSQSPQLHEEAKSAALRDFEETRNLAAHHSQLRAECNLKAKQAVQSGNGSVALYYSEIAQLHKKKIDMFNHRAANCIVEVHKYTQNNPDLLDLHYLHTMEAVACLDLFLDRHITVLRNHTRVYKHVFIITGRGLHSTNGVSTIKKKVKARLLERGLRWQEVNPGLLRVKVFSASRHSKNF